jgi:hypothetical protein
MNSVGIHRRATSHSHKSTQSWLEKSPEGLSISTTSYPCLNQTRSNQRWGCQVPWPHSTHIPSWWSGYTSITYVIICEINLRHQMILLFDIPCPLAISSRTVLEDMAKGQGISKRSIWHYGQGARDLEIEWCHHIAASSIRVMTCLISIFMPQQLKARAWHWTKKGWSPCDLHLFPFSFYSLLSCCSWTAWLWNTDLYWP